MATALKVLGIAILASPLAVFLVAEAFAWAGVPFLPLLAIPHWAGFGLSAVVASRYVLRTARETAARSERIAGIVEVWGGGEEPEVLRVTPRLTSSLVLWLVVICLRIAASIGLPPGP